MRVLLDTNLLIGREDPKVVDEVLSELLRLLSSNSVGVVIHPRSVDELTSDKDSDRRTIILSKIRSYPVLAEPPACDADFVYRAGGAASSHDTIDIELLAAVRANAVSFLITADEALIKRAAKIELSDRVFNVHLGLQYFDGLFGKAYPKIAPPVRRSFVYKLDPRDTFFDSFRSDYTGFDDWLARVAQSGRTCYQSTITAGSLGSVLILKDDDYDPICDRPSMRRLKICTLKVSSEQSGFRLGERLISIALDYGKKNRFAECFVTVFPKYGELTGLLATFGFEPLCSKPNGEVVMLKVLQPPVASQSEDPVPYLKTYFPSFRDDSSVRKFMVPIRPNYHRELFPSQEGRGVQLNLDGGAVVPPPAGNAIRKAYLSNSKTRRVRAGDVLLFYRSRDDHAVTHRGVVEAVKTCRTPEEILDFVGNRTVLKLDELKRLCDKPVLSLLFWNVGTVNPPISLGALSEIDVAWPQAVSELGDTQYNLLFERGRKGS